MPTRLHNIGPRPVTDMTIIVEGYGAGQEKLRQFGKIITDGVLDPSERNKWGRIRTAEERGLVQAALRYVLAIGVIDEGHSVLADEAQHIESNRILTVVERAQISQAVDVLASADVGLMTEDASVATFVHYVAPAMYAQGFRMPHQTRPLSD